MVVARPGISLFAIVWLVAGVAVAASHDYLQNVDNGRRIASAILAVLLWPLLLVGIDLHVHP
jgi:hypothetical protein